MYTHALYLYHVSYSCLCFSIICLFLILLIILQANLGMTDHCKTDFCLWRTICLVLVLCISSMCHMYMTDFAYDGPNFLVLLSLSYPSSLAYSYYTSSIYTTDQCLVFLPSCFLLMLKIYFYYSNICFLFIFSYMYNPIICFYTWSWIKYRIVVAYLRHDYISTTSVTYSFWKRCMNLFISKALFSPSVPLSSCAQRTYSYDINIES